MLRFFVGLLLCQVLMSACVFQGYAPDNMSLRCDSDADCVTGRCVAQVCRRASADATAPTLVAIEVPDRVVADVSWAVLVEASEPLAKAPVLTFDAASDVVVASTTVTGNSAVVTLTTASTTDAVVVIDAVTLTDNADNTTIEQLGEVVVVDATPPLVGPLVVEPTVVAHDQPYEVSFSIDQDVQADGGSASVFVSGVRLPCSINAGAAGSMETRCTGTATGLTEGVQPVLLVVRDAAGHLVRGAGSIVVDNTPPQLIDTAVTLFAVGSNNVVAQLLPGGRLQLATTATEDALLSVVLRSPFAVDIALGEAAIIAGVNVIDWTLPSELAPAIYQVTLTAIDVAANAGMLVLAQTYEALFDAAPACVATSGTGDDVVPICSDSDGDGALGRGPHCPIGTDCDDANPLVFGGALEIPGDDRDNTCATNSPGRPVPTDAIYVATDGDDNNAGTAEQPVASLVAAGSVMAGPPRDTFIVRPGTYVEQDFVNNDSSNFPHFVLCLDEANEPTLDVELFFAEQVSVQQAFVFLGCTLHVAQFYGTRGVTFIGSQVLLRNQQFDSVYVLGKISIINGSLISEPLNDDYYYAHFTSGDLFASFSSIYGVESYGTRTAVINSHIQNSFIYGESGLTVHTLSEGTHWKFYDLVVVQNEWRRAPIHHTYFDNLVSGHDNGNLISGRDNASTALVANSIIDGDVLINTFSPTSVLFQNSAIRLDHLSTTDTVNDIRFDLSTTCVDTCSGAETSIILDDSVDLDDITTQQAFVAAGVQLSTLDLQVGMTDINGVCHSTPPSIGRRELSTP